MKKNRFIRLCALCAVLVLALTGCLSSAGSGEAQTGASNIEDAAKNEGQLTWYTSIPEATAQRVATGFEEEYGIRVELIVLSSGLLTSRYSSEMASGASAADVITVAEPRFFADAVQQGWTVPFTEADMPNLAGWPGDYLVDNQYALINIQPIGVTINTGMVDESEFTKSWEFLVDPKYQGQFQAVDPKGIPAWVAHMLLLKQTYGDDFLTKLGAQQPKWVDSSVPGAQQVAAGGGSFVYPSLLSVSNPLSDKGAPVKTVFPSPTTGVEQFAGISSKAPNPNAARLFMNYLLGEEAQQMVNQGVGSSPLGELEGTVPLPEGYTRPNMDEAVAQKDEVLRELGRS